MRSASQSNGVALLIRMGGSRPIDVKVHRIRRASAVPIDPSSMRPALPAGGLFENLAGFGNWDHVPRAPRPSRSGALMERYEVTFSSLGAAGRVGHQCPGGRRRMGEAGGLGGGPGGWSSRRGRGWDVTLCMGDP